MIDVFQFYCEGRKSGMTDIRPKAFDSDIYRFLFAHKMEERQTTVYSQRPASFFSFFSSYSQLELLWNKLMNYVTTH
jgi:hypothetical protein